MAITLTWPLTSDGAGAVTYTANDWRTLLTNLFGEGILGASSFEVTERAAGANMQLDIAAGVAVLAGDDAAGQGNYLVEATQTLTAVTIGTADATNPRIDLVGIQLRDPSEGGAAGRDCIFAVVAGTPAGSPSAPAVPDSFLTLASVLVPAAASSIDDGDITDLRVHAVLTHGAVLPAGSVDTTELVDSAVTAAKLAASAVTTAKITDANVTTAKIATGAVTTAKIADLNVTTDKIATGAVATAKIAAGAITNTRIGDGEVIESKIGGNAVTTAKIADANVTLAKLASAVYAAGGTLASGTISYVKIMGWVFVTAQGVAESNSAATLPAGYRPSESVSFPMTNDLSTPDIHRVVISTGGVIDTLPSTGSTGSVRRFVAFFPAA